MSATNAFETALLNLLFTNVALANVGDASGLQPSATAGSFYISLHTATLTETSVQDTTEAAYTDYARVAVARAGSAWTISGDTVSNAAAIVFPKCTGSTAVVTDFGLGSASSGAGNLQLYGVLAASLSISNGITPEFEAGALDISID